MATWHSKLGCVYHLAYPFIPKTFLSRSEELIQSTRREIEIEAQAVFSGCSLRSSTVQDPADSTNSGAPTALGIFATCDIAQYFPFFVDSTVLAATENYGRSGDVTEICDNCYGTIPTNSSQKRSASCCTVIYCNPHHALRRRVYRIPGSPRVESNGEEGKGESGRGAETRVSSRGSLT